MKRLTTICTAWFLMAGPAMLGAQTTAQAEKLLESARHKEVMEGDLKAAIEQYRKIATQFAGQPEIAARALYQLGQCQEKLGQAEARKAYERIVRDYSGAQQYAAMARSRLAAIGGGAGEARARLVWDDAIDLWGTVSADGRYLSFVDRSTGDLAVRDLLRGTNRRVTDKGGYAKALAETAGSVISPDAERIAFNWERYDAQAKKEGQVELRVIGADGKGEKLLKRVHGWIAPHGWSPDEKWIATVYQEPAFVEHDIMLVSVEDGKSVTLPIKEKGAKQRITFSPDGQWLAYSSDGILYTVRADGSAAAESRVELGAMMMAWTPDGKGILFSRKHEGANRLYLIPVSQGKAAGEAKMIRSEPLPDGLSLGMTAHGALVFGAPNIQTAGWLCEFDGRTGQLGRRLRQLPAENIGPPILNSSLKFAPDSKRLLYGASRQGIRIHEVATGIDRTLMPQLARFQPLEWAPDGASLLVAGIGFDGKDALYRVDLQSGAAIFLAARVPESRILSGTDGSAMVYADKDGAVIRRELSTSAERVLFRKAGLDQIPEVAFSHDGRKMAVRAALRYLGVVDLATGQVRDLYEKKIGEPKDSIWAIDWSADDRKVVAVGIQSFPKGPTRILSFPVDGGEPHGSVAPSQLRGLSLSPDGKLAGVLAFTRRYQVLALENFLPTK